MAHERLRHLQSLIEKRLKFSPLVGLLGHRQVGKTTVISKIAASYQTLDLAKTLDAATIDPEAFLASLLKRPAAIDEAQLCPPLFPALKEFVRLHKKPGQFLLSGSVRFTSRKAIRESLTGRIVNLELLPFCHSEMEQLPPQSLPVDLMTQDLSRFKSCMDNLAVRRKHEKLLRYGETGGLPGLCFLRDAGIRSDQIETNLQTILDRDLRLIYETSLRYATLKSVLQYLANHQGSPLNLSDMARKTRVSIPTQRHLLAAFENLFLIRILPSLEGEKAPVVFFEDQGEAAFLRQESYDPFTNWLRILYANVRVPFSLKPELNAQFFQFRTLGGAFVPLAVKTRNHVLGFSISLETNPTEATIKSSHRFTKKFKNSKVLILSPHAKTALISQNVLQLPFAEII